MLATNGDHRLGGKDWDDVIVNYVAEEFDRAHGENPLLDLQSYQDLHSRALAAKIQLSSRPQTRDRAQHNGKSVKVEITREEFEKRTPAPGREVQDHLRNGHAGSEHELGRHRQDFARGWHDSNADGAGDDRATLDQCRCDG